MTTKWNYPTDVRFGAGAAELLPEVLDEYSIARPLVVTDSGLAGSDIIEKVMSVCAGRVDTALFHDLAGNPQGKHIDAGVLAARTHRADGVVAVGGGSAIDGGKAIALMVGQTRPMWDFEDVGDNYTRVNTKGVLPTVAVPTTSGTGSEVGRSSVITNADEKRKVIVFHPLMMPVTAVCDPALTLSLPKKLTAATGMDALSHNLEAYCAKGYHPLGEGIALNGIRLVQKSLVKAVEEPGDIEARTDMMAASLMGATAFQKGLGAMHAMSHPVGAYLGQHHGLINAVVMPYVLSYNRVAIEERIVALARWMDLSSSTFDGFLDWVLQLRKRVGIPHTSDALNVSTDNVDVLSEMAAVDPAGGGNPISLQVEDYRRLFMASLSGELPEPKTA